MGSESIAHELLTQGHEGERNNCFSKIQLIAQKIENKKLLAS